MKRGKVVIKAWRALAANFIYNLYDKVCNYCSLQLQT